MSLISRMRRQDAVYWAPGPTSSTGNPTYLPAIQIKCRWEDTQMEFVDGSGRDTVSKSVVYTEVVTKVGGVLFRGSMSQLVSQTEPFSNPGATEIRGSSRIPNLKNTEELLIAML